MAPVFWTNNVINAGGWRLVDGHRLLKFTVMQASETDFTSLSGIAFLKGNHFDRIHDYEPFCIYYRWGYNTWQDKIKLQRNVMDTKFAEEL